MTYVQTGTGVLKLRHMVEAITSPQSQLTATHKQLLAQVPTLLLASLAAPLAVSARGGALACSLPLPPRNERSRCDTHMCEYVCDCVCVWGVRECGVQVLEMCMHYRERDRAFQGGRAPMHLNLCDDLGSARKQEVLSGDGCCVNETVLAKLLKLGYLRSFFFFYLFSFSICFYPSPLLDLLRLQRPMHSKVCRRRG